jgi:hypothetical protein
VQFPPPPLTIVGYSDEMLAASVLPYRDEGRSETRPTSLSWRMATSRRASAFRGSRRNAVQASLNAFRSPSSIVARSEICQAFFDFEWSRTDGLVESSFGLRLTFPLNPGARARSGRGQIGWGRTIARKPPSVRRPVRLAGRGAGATRQSLGRGQHLAHPARGR